MEKVINTIYLLSGLILALIVIMAISSCGTTKMYNVGTGKELSKSRCTGNYVYK